MELKLRKDLIKEHTWDLSRLFKSEKDYNLEVERLNSLVDKFVIDYKNKLNNSTNIVNALKDYEEILKLIYYTNSYASLSLSVDQTDEDNLIRAGKMSNVISNVSNKLAFLDNEIIKNNEDVLKEVIKKDYNTKNYIEKLIDFQKHRLSDSEENLLTNLNSIFKQPYSNYERFKLADMKFDSFTYNNEVYELSFNNFESTYESYINNEIRRKAFDSFYKTLRMYENGLGNNYYTHVLTEKKMAELRGFNSVIDYLLFNQKVSKDLYNRQIDITMELLSKPMQKYAKLIKEEYKLDKITFADLKLPLDPEYEPEVSIKDAKKYVYEALSYMGEEYSKIVFEANNKRWIDFPQNIGKSTGGFCSSPYRKGSFILLNWNNQMDEAFVLAHELGHACHYHFASHNNSIYNYNASLYFIEAPSTMNELLMAKYFMNKSKDIRFKRWVLSTLISRTYYHNFVTHLLEAHYQREVYKLIDNNQPITGKTLTKLKEKTLKQFWGDVVEITNDDGLTWMRQPHYYMGLYPYTYSAGLTIATNVVNKFDKEELDPKDWIEVLKAGGTKDPVELAKMVNIDLNKDIALKETINYIDEIINEIIRLTKKINKEN